MFWIIEPMSGPGVFIHSTCIYHYAFLIILLISQYIYNSRKDQTAKSPWITCSHNLIQQTLTVEQVINKTNKISQYFTLNKEQMFCAITVVQSQNKSHDIEVTSGSWSFTISLLNHLHLYLVLHGSWDPTFVPPVLELTVLLAWNGSFTLFKL